MKRLLSIVIIGLLSWTTYGQDINMQDGTFNVCSGSFFDSGGAAGPYANNESFVLTLCSDGSGGILQVDFTAFTTETPNDVLTIYDGDNTTAPVIGDFSGTNSPGIVRPSPSNTSGCLTFAFVSNEFFTSTGWEATISCCEEITTAFEGSTPPAAGGVITADVDEVITVNASAVFAGSDVGATYTWDFGDGTIMSGLTAMHSYSSPGLYPISFTATDAAGCADQTRLELTADIDFDITVGNPFVDAGPDQTLDCSAGEVCADLNADFLSIGETTTYRIIPIPFDPPFSFNGLANSLNPDIDDAWSNVQGLPFDFCFFGGAETEFQVGSNGVIRFDVDPSDTGVASNGWSFDEDLPNNSNPTLGEANIFTPGHDINPATSDFEEVGYEVIGEAPNRVLVVSYFEVPMFSASCGDLLATQMAVLYETTNIIDIYMLNKPVCDSWNDGNAVLGIQNDAGTEAFVPPGRNTSNSPWTAEFEAWRFIPDGPDVTTVTWLDESGTVIGDTRSITVCPSGTETYTARVDYLNCNGETVTVEDTVTVTSNATFSFDLGDDINTCDTDPVPLDADTGTGGVTYQWFLDDLPIGGATSPTLDATVSGTYRCEVTDGECTVSDTVVVTFFETPVANEPADLTACDDDNDGFAEFTLTDLDAEIIDGQPDTFVNYYLTEAEADAGDTAVALSSPFTNTENPQTLWARIENSGGCFDTVSFTLTVFDSPVVNDPIPPFELCDDETADGITLFDLTSWEDQVTSDSLLGLSFYETEADANAAIGAISDPTAYLNTANPQLIWVRAENDDGCFTVTSFELIVNANPITTTPEEYLICDEVPFDGFTEFDLTSRDAEISTGASGVIVSYYLTLAEAEIGDTTVSLVSPYTNTSNPQIVYARVEDEVTGCFSIEPLELEVLDTPAATSPEPLQVCDEDNDGFAQFDLTTLDGVISGGVAGVVVSYHLTEADATDNVGPLSSPYTNTVADTQIVYARVSNPAAGDCFSVVAVTLEVLASPEIADPSPLTACDDDQDGIFTFDLSSRSDEILNGLSAADYTVSFYEDVDLSLLISDPANYDNIANPQTVYVVVTDNTSGCSNTTTLLLEVFANPIIVDPTPFELCDNNNPGDETEAFDLTQKNDEITAGASGLVVTYHETEAEAESGTAALAIPYENTSNPQTVYVRVQDGTTGCFSTTSLELRVLPAPVVNTPDPLTVCGTSDGTGVFDLASVIAEVSGGSSGLDVSFHSSQADAQSGANPLPLEYTNSTNPEVIYVRVTDFTTGCYNTTTLELNVTLAPILARLDTVELCAEGTNDTAVYNLNELAGLLGQEDSGLTLSFYTSNANAEAGDNPITNIENYEVADGDSIYIRAETADGCQAITVVDFSVAVCEVVIPQGISPNSDGFNDTFDISGLELHPNFELKIFDRRGIMVYSANASTENWDGRAAEQNGELLPVGTYFYTLQLNDPPGDERFDQMQQLYSGWVYLNY